MLSSQFSCRHCGSLEGYQSRPRGFIEKRLLRLILMRPVRCADCFRRHYQPIFVQVRKRPESHISYPAAA